MRARRRSDYARAIKRALETSKAWRRRTPDRIDAIGFVNGKRYWRCDCSWCQMGKLHSSKKREESMSFTKYDLDYDIDTGMGYWESIAFEDSSFYLDADIYDEEADNLKWLRQKAELEDGCEIGVGGLLVDLGLYKNERDGDVNGLY